MLLSKTPLPSAEPLDTHDALLQREEAGARQRRRRRWLVTGLVLAAVGGLAVGARPALHVAKAWQARRLARQAVSLTEAGKLDEARIRVQDALTIWRQEPEALHAAAFFLTHAGAYRPAAPFWQQLDETRPLTPADTRDYALTELNLGEADRAETLARRVWPSDEEGTWQDWLLAMQIALRRGRAAEAIPLAVRLLHDGAIPAHVRLGAAAALVSSNAASPDDQALAWENLIGLAHAETTPESLSALLLLAQARASAHPVLLPANTPALPELLARIDAHPLAKAAQGLLVLDLRLSQEPDRRAEFLQAAVDRYGQTKDDADLAALAGWLYAKGEYERVLAVLPPARAATDHALYLQSLDALAALGRWTEIRESIQARKFPLDPMLAQMFLARCAGQLGEPEVRDARWQAALDAAGKDPAKLLSLGQYAAKNGTDNIAAAAFEGAVRAAPDALPMREELIHFLETAGDTHRLRAAVNDALVRWPQDPALRNDSAYLDALSNENVPAARGVARELVRAQPANLAFRTTLALCELRLHDGLAALDAFSRRDLNESTPVLTPRQAAVYAAVLWEASYPAEAAAALRSAPLAHLLPEERALITPIKPVDHP